MVEVLGINAFPNGGAPKYWWQYALVGIVAASTLIGLTTILWNAIRALRRSSARKSSDSLSVDVQRHIKEVVERARQGESRGELAPARVSTFGVYLGEIPWPPTPEQLRVLSRWDLLVVDANKSGVLRAIDTPDIPKSDNVAARLDLGEFFKPKSDSSDLRTELDHFEKITTETFLSPSRPNCFKSALLAGWEGCCDATILNTLAEILSIRGVHAYIEIRPPDFLSALSSPLNLSIFSGVVVKNGTVLPNGERRDFFDMDKMKSTIKAFVSQSCLRPFPVMMWEDIDVKIQLSHAVIKRSHTWCSYHGAVPWFGNAKSLVDASHSVGTVEPLNAFQWLKENRVMKIHEKHRLNRKFAQLNNESVQDFDQIISLFPEIKDVVSFLHNGNQEDGDIGSSSASTLTIENSALEGLDHLPSKSRTTSLDWVKHMPQNTVNPLSKSPLGQMYLSFGCFPLGFDASQDDFTRVVRSQQRLRRLRLLDRVSPTRLHQIGKALVSLQNQPGWSRMPEFVRNCIRHFSELCAVARETNQDDDPFQVYLSLDSGFRCPSGAKFWSVQEIDPENGAVIYYVSKSAKDLPGILLHTFMSSKSLLRHQCFQAEFAIHNCRNDDNSGRMTLPDRLQQDLDMLSPSEILLLLQHIRFSHYDETSTLLYYIRAACEEILLDVPAYKQLKQLGNVDYIGGKVSDADLVMARTEWYRQQSHSSLSTETALKIFRDVEGKLRSFLRTGSHVDMHKLTEALETLSTRPMDLVVDFIFFSVFCSTRRAAFEEVYLEVSDRNPLFNEYSDQSAAFAELFALGSRCESYFDVVPSVFGKLLSEKHREHYNKPENQPPMWIENAPAFASAYAAAQTDIDPDQKPSTMPAYRRFTFLSVFAIPALVDIVLLTFTGRGLYLSAFMSQTEAKNATLALMISLLVSGAIGTWISIGGTYYLISMAFSAANMFVLTRLIGGLAFTFAGGVLGFIIVSGTGSVSGGAVFLFYLVGLTAYLTLLAVLSSYQFPGSSFLNGRYVIIFLIPSLLISPILTMWVNGYDVIIYLCILYGFVILLALGTRHVGANWATWCYNIKKVDDAEVKSWFMNTSSLEEKRAIESLSEPAVLALCRGKLHQQVMKEKNRRFWHKKSKDVLVIELARSWDSTVFLLDWYCRLSDVKRPIPYSSTWNLETQVAHDSLVQNQKGIRLHNSFLHWRNAGDEIGCGVLYFFVALMDRWIELLYDGPLIGLGASLNSGFRMAVGFSLAYYLIGAVLLDYKAQHLHQMSMESSPISIKSTELIHDAVLNDARFKQRLYRVTLLRFLGVHVWALAVSAALVWIFDGGQFALIMFLAYISAYSGLLLYQYNKIFSGPHAPLPLLAATIVAFPIGMILRSVQPEFVWNGVIALGIATWTAAILSLRTAKIALPHKKRHPEKIEPCVYHVYSSIGSNHDWSQSELGAFYDSILALPKEERFLLDSSTHPGVEIKEMLLSCSSQTLPQIVMDSFPNAVYLMQKIVSKWENGGIEISLVSMRSIIKAEAGIRAISCVEDGHLSLVIASDADSGYSGPISISSNCRLIAEVLLHAGTECLLGLTHDHAYIAESLLVAINADEMQPLISENTRRVLVSEISDSKKTSLTLSFRKELLKSLCFGLDCEISWDDLPLDIRKSFLQRCLGYKVNFSSLQMMWLNNKTVAEGNCAITTRMARYNLNALVAAQMYNDMLRFEAGTMNEKEYAQRSPDVHFTQEKRQTMSVKSTLTFLYRGARKPVAKLYHILCLWMKFSALTAVADPDYQRELHAIQSRQPKIVARPVTFALTWLWRYSRFVQSLVLPFFLFHGRNDLRLLTKAIKGTVITLKKNRLVIKKLDSITTAFVHSERSGGFKLLHYKGELYQQPTSGPTAISVYSGDMRLLSRTEFAGEEVSNEYLYNYNSEKKARRLSKFNNFGNSRIPLLRSCIKGKDEGSLVQYNQKGHIDSGSYTKDGNLVRFKYHYRKNAKYDDELLRAEFVMPHLTCNVSWCAPPVRHPEKLERWIPHSRVYEATFVQGPDVFECNWLYDHKFHPTITTSMNGQVITTPDLIRFDWLGVLKKPSNTAFLDDNPMLNFRSFHSSLLSRALRMNSHHLPVSTSKARSSLWRAWKKRSDIDGIVVRWQDEKLLRSDTLLRPYWRARNQGNLLLAEDYLALHADAVVASAELATDISAWTPLAIRISDLFSFGQGGDSVVFTRTKILAPDQDDVLHVIAVDTGTWPNEGGGVSACRRDLINNLHTIRWHMVVESANDFGLPKHQTEENVESLKVIPLWGLDFMHPTHGMFDNKLDSEVDHLVREATEKDIQLNFLPTLSALVRGARATNLTQADLKQATRALVNLNTYFQDSRHWKEVWTSAIVKDAWRHLWLSDDMPNAKAPSEWFNTELPTLGHLETALDLWFRYLFIFSIPIPEQIPAVFQASHHSVSASYGIVCKIKRNCTLQIWDHAISWRETNLYLSSALCTLPPFIRNALLGLMKLTSTLVLHHADNVLPCADFFNPGWEVEIGTSQGSLEHRNTFKRKVDPIVNGITDMQKFAPVRDINTKKPTVTMLSHVWFAKDIKTALLAADIITNEWGFKDYELAIYGALNKAPVYSSECQEILACKGLGTNVSLKGTADPAKVLADTWLFLNSSVSEGLPLALGEAALTGAPVVCTDVGASLRVLTDPDDNERYSEVVAPNDPYALARAQINILAMLDQWSVYAEDNPSHPAPILPVKPTSADVEIITRRMYEKAPQRRKLGMMARNIVQKSFSGERYLREHEQMLWIGKSQYEMQGMPERTPQPLTSGAKRLSVMYGESMLVDEQTEKMAHPRPPFQTRRSGTTSFSSVYLDRSPPRSTGASLFEYQMRPKSTTASISSSKLLYSPQKSPQLSDFATPVIPSGSRSPNSDSTSLRSPRSSTYNAPYIRSGLSREIHNL